jgi:N-acetylneuraminate synthase
MTTIEIDRFLVGRDTPPFIIAEAGVHHFNSVELAKTYILQARIAGVQAIKFQTYTASRIAARWAPTYWDSEGGLTQYDIFAERSKLTREDYGLLFAYARELGVLFMSTPFDQDAASMLHELGMAAFKIASADITHFPLLRHIKQFNKPVLLSTGASTLDEIRQAVTLLDGVPIALLHCSLSYPTAITDANLGRITTLQREFPDLVIGYSDHTQPQDTPFACPLAVGLGARIIEKHYTLNKHLAGDDHYHAVDQAGLIQLVRDCNHAFTMAARSEEMTAAEQAARQYARRSIVAARDIPAGTFIDETLIDFKRPGTGISPAQVDQVIGRRTRHDIAADALILFDHLDALNEGQ